MKRPQHQRPLSSGHLNPDELLAQFYGVGGNEAHVNECPECSARLQAMERKRQGSAAATAAPVELLAQQRRAIYARIDSGLAAQARWAPALAAAFLLAISVALVHPYLRSHPAQPVASARAVNRIQPSEDRLFSDLYSMEQSVEPEAAAPIHELFEDDGGR